MTGISRLDDLDQQGVIVTVGRNGNYLLHMAGSRSFVPKGLTAAAEKPGVSGREGSFQGFPVHIGQHENFTGSSLLHNGGNQIPLLEILLDKIVHGLFGMHMFTGNPMSCQNSGF